METRKVRWLLAHEPVRLFERAAKAFAKEINEKTNGKLEVEILTVSEYAKKYNNNSKVGVEDVIELLRSNRLEMSQTYTVDLGRLWNDMRLFDLPYLFKDHDHVAKVLESQVGQHILTGLSKRSNIHGLAFTYSGGYIAIPSDREITSVEDFKGLKIRCQNSPVIVDTLKALGAEPIEMPIDHYEQAVLSGELTFSTRESTFSRVEEVVLPQGMTTVINDTKHHVFLTSILVNNEFWSSLDSNTKEIFQQAAIDAARLERDESIEDEAVMKERYKEQGIKIVDFPEEEKEKFKKAVESVYKKYEKDYFTPGLLQSVLKYNFTKH